MKRSSAIIGRVRVSAFICAITLGVSYGTAIAQEIPYTPMEPAFNDVDVGDEHYIAIKFLKDRNIIQGYEDGSFHPEREINRAEALKIILGTLYKAPQKGITAQIDFPDVSPNDWFAPQVEKGLENGIISGYPDGLFHPERTLNKAESLKMVLLQENNPLPVTINEPPYSDVPVDEWFASYAQVSKERGLFIENRSAGALEPEKNLNRGNFAELIYHMLQSSNNKRFGRATYYADILAGRGTASGDPYDPRIFTVAHKTLPFGTRMHVTNLANGKSVEVKVNDRGPYATGVELDLSRSAFEAIASASTGIIFTQFQILE